MLRFPKQEKRNVLQFTKASQLATPFSIKPHATHGRGKLQQILATATDLFISSIISVKESSSFYNT
jgi:hypothetical protein